MKTLLTFLVSLSVSLSAFAGIPYVISPTNTGTLGMQLFYGGPAGVNYWDWSTNAAGSNSTVVSASASIGITTNGFNFTPFLSAQFTNWITGQDTVVSNGVYGLFNGGTNITFGYARSLSAADTNNDTVVSNGVYGLFNGGTNITFGYARTIGDLATNRVDYASNKLWLMITNVYVDTGTGGSTNRSGQNVTYTIVPGTGGSGTGIATNNGTGTNNIFTGPTLVGSGASSNALLVTYGTAPVLQSRTNGDLFIIGTLNSTNFVGPTNAPTDAYVLTATGTAGFTKWAAAAAGSGTGIQTNGGTGSNNILTGPIVSGPFFTNNVQRLYNSRTNGFMNVVNAVDYGLSTSGDQTANINAAITAATNNGVNARVFIPAGTYTINGQLLVKGVILEGESNPGNSTSGNGTILSCAAGDNAIVYVLPGPSGATIRNISFIGTVTNGIGITTATNNGTDTTSIRIENCTFFRLKYASFLSHANLLRFNNNYITQCLEGIVAGDQVNRLSVEGHFASLSGHGIYGTGANCYNWNIHAAFQVCSNGVCANNGLEGLNVAFSYFEGNTYDVVANGSYDVNVTLNEFGGSIVNTNIFLASIDKLYIGHNDFSDSASTNWDIASGCVGVNFGPNRHVSGQAQSNRTLTWTRVDGTNFVTSGGKYYGDGSSLTNLPSSGGGGGTNAATTVLSFADPLATDLTTPVGCITNGIRTFRTTATSAFTLSNPSGTFIDGQRAIWEIIQDGTGGRIITMGNKFAFGTDITGITLSTAASKHDFITAVYNGTADLWYVVGFVRGY